MIKFLIKTQYLNILVILLDKMSKSQSQNFLEPLFKEVQNSILKKETENEDSNKKIDWNKQKHEIDPFINQHELNRIF